MLTAALYALAAWGALSLPITVTLGVGLRRLSGTPSPAPPPVPPEAPNVRPVPPEVARRVIAAWEERCCDGKGARPRKMNLDPSAN